MTTPLLQPALSGGDRGPPTAEAGISIFVLGNHMLFLPLSVGAVFPRGSPRSQRSDSTCDPSGAWPLYAGFPDLQVYSDQVLLPFRNQPESPFPEGPRSWVFGVTLEAFRRSQVRLPVELPVLRIYFTELGLLFS